MAASEVARGGGGLGTGAAGGAAEVQPDFSELNGVQIAVRAAVGGDAPGEWTMVELQGTVETGKAPLPGLEVGELTILPGVRVPAPAPVHLRGVSKLTSWLSRRTCLRAVLG